MLRVNEFQLEPSFGSLNQGGPGGHVPGLSGAMKQEPETTVAMSQEPVALTILELGQTSSPQKLVKTSISVPGEVKMTAQQQQQQQQQAVTLVVNSEPVDMDLEPPLCDEILSCISALDEVIAEFETDDSISTSSSTTSFNNGSEPQQASKPKGLSHESRKLEGSEFVNSKPGKKSGKQGKSKSQEEPLVKIMQTESQTVTEIRIGTSHLPTQQIQLEQRHFSPVKPARQGKVSVSNSPYQIESSPSKGTYTSYGIIFPKASPSRIPVSPSNRNGGSNKGVTVLTAGAKDSSTAAMRDSAGVTLSIGESSPVEGTKGGHGGSFPKVKTRTMELPTSPLSSQSMKVPLTSPHKPIPLFPPVMEEGSDRKTPEVWDFHIDRNLPRSLRKTRKTCFVDDEEEDEENHKNDIRKGKPKITSTSVNEIPQSQSSPMLSKKAERLELEAKISEKTIRKDAEAETHAGITQWLRYDDKLMELPFDDKERSLDSPSLPIRNVVKQGSEKPSVIPAQPPGPPNGNRDVKKEGATSNKVVSKRAKSQSHSGSANNGSRKGDKSGKSQSFNSNAVPRPRQQQSNFNLAPPPPSTTMVSPGPVLDVDDGYLSMINRHEAPILWPEGFIESETFSAEELKQLSAQLNYLTEEVGHMKNGRSSSNEQKTDYFSDDSLEFDGETEVQPKKTKLVPQYHSYFISSATVEPAQLESIPKPVNVQASRKSWSPAGEIRLPPGTKSSINTNTWRKGPPSNVFDENEENLFNAARKSSPRRKPCAFFIPMHDLEITPTRDSGVQTSPVETSIPPPISASSVQEPISLPDTEMDSLELISAFAKKIVDKALRSAIPEAAAINTLLASTVEDTSEEVLENVSLDDSEIDSDLLFPSEDRIGTSVNSSLGLSAEGKLSSLNRMPSSVDAETSSSSGIDYETSSEGRGQGFDSLELNGYNLLDGEQEAPASVKNCAEPRAELLDFIEDLHDQPPPFIPPPPKSQTSPAVSPVVLRDKDLDRSSAVRESVISSGSERDSFPQGPPLIVVTERALRTHRQTSRSHENLLDIDRRTEYLPHPCVRRGHSATLPPNSVPPTTQRRPSAFRQLLGIFKRNKKQTNGSVSSSIMDLPIHSSQRDLDSSIYSHQDQHFPLPDHFYPKLVSRPSISESQGSHRSKDSRSSSNKRSVLSRIFRRK